MAEKKIYFVQQRRTPAVCRSRRLRQAGVSPSDAQSLRRMSTAFRSSDEELKYYSSTEWTYYPGNCAARAVLVERGDYDRARSADSPFYFRSFNADTMLYERHTAWRDGIRWHCVEDETDKVPGYNRGGWQRADGFENLLIAVSAEKVAEQTWEFTVEVRGGESREKIEPIGSIPKSESGWRKETIGGSQEDVQYDQQFNASHKGYGTTKFRLGRESLGSGKYVDIIFYMRMAINNNSAELLYDKNLNELTDVWGEALYNCPCGDSAETDTEVKEVTGRITINLDN